MDQNNGSAHEKDYLNLCDVVVDAAVWRLEHSMPFADNELDLLLHISSEDTDRILTWLDDDEVRIFSGLLWARQEAIAARFQEACRHPTIRH